MADRLDERKVIFIDLSVLRTERTHYRTGDHACVDCLNRLTDQTGAKLVVTSSWRRTISHSRSVLRFWGATATVIGITPKVGRKTGVQASRCDEIQTWLDLNGPAGRMVILDAGDDLGHLLPWLVRTQTEAGLTEVEADRAARLLTEGAGRNDRRALHVLWMEGTAAA